MKFLRIGIRGKLALLDDAEFDAKAYIGPKKFPKYSYGSIKAEYE